MKATVADIIGIMEGLAPGRLAEQWDNVGLQVGDARWPVARIWVALDPARGVVEAACEAGADMLITHHPLIFKPLAAIDAATETGGIIRKALIASMAIYAAHTNLDSAADGLNDRLAGILGLDNSMVLEPAKPMDQERPEATVAAPIPGEGLGRVGMLPVATTLADLAEDIKKRLGLTAVRVVGQESMSVDRVAVCTGSGASLLDKFFASGARVYITGDLKYHDARQVEARGLGAIDIGHFASEYIVVPLLAEQLGSALAGRGITVDITGCSLEKDPFIYY